MAQSGAATEFKQSHNRQFSIQRWLRREASYLPACFLHFKDLAFSSLFNLSFFFVYFKNRWVVLYTNLTRIYIYTQSFLIIVMTTSLWICSKHLMSLKYVLFLCDKDSETWGNLSRSCSWLELSPGFTPRLSGSEGWPLPLRNSTA